MSGKSVEPVIQRRLSKLAERQHGIVTRRQLRAIGFTDDQIDWRIRRGLLIPLYRGVYAVGHRALSRKGEWLAGVAALGAHGVLSHRSAGALWRLIPDEFSFVECSSRKPGGRRSRDGLIVHRAPSVKVVDITKEERIPVTKPARTLLDLATVLERRPLERAVDEAERLRLCRPRQLRAVVERYPGHHGSGALAAVLDEHVAGSTATVNDFEESFLAICDRFEVQRPLVNQRLGPYRPDFLWPEAKLIVETDGRDTHGTRRAFEADRRRDAELTTAGYRVLRFTWRHLTREPEWVARKLIEALAATSSSR